MGCHIQVMEVVTRHAKAIVMSMAYSLYHHCAEGSVDPDWKVVAVSGLYAEDVSSDGAVQSIKHAVSWGFKDAKGNSDKQEEAWRT